MGLVGIIPSATKTFEVFGDFNEHNLVEGKLYWEPSSKRIFYYSLIEKRSSSASGYFPIWDGVNTYVNSHSKDKYLDNDVIMCDINTIGKSVTKDIADSVIYNQRKVDNDSILKPMITDGDNMFTQCIKGVISSLNVTMIDLVDMTSPKLTQKQVENYYSALNKITFMRLDKWNIWVNNILHLTYRMDIIMNNKPVIVFNYPLGTFDIDNGYEDIINGKDDPYKKIVKSLMKMKNITKSDLKTDDVDDYTINNMMTTLNGPKPLSAQLFSRFIRMIGLTYKVTIFKDSKQIFEFKE